MTKIVFIYLTVTAYCIVQNVNSQFIEVPHIACPQYFQYFYNVVNYFGKITLANIQPGVIEVQVQFSQRAPMQGNFNMALFEDPETTYKKIASGVPISYRVDFPMPYMLPKLTQISINGRVICSDFIYPEPSLVVTLKHTSLLPAQVIFTPMITQTYENANMIQHIPIQTDTINVRNASRSLRIPNIIEENSQSSSPNHSLIQANSQQFCGEEGGQIRPIQIVAGGRLLPPGYFPWLTAIYKKSVGIATFICGGSLISSRTVLSAAHCFQMTNLNAENIIISLGHYNIFKSMESGAIWRDIQTLLINPEYDPKFFPDADVALLIMLEPVSFTEFIKPVCLWTGSEDVNLVINQTGYVAGWGGDSNGNVVSSLPSVVPAKIVAEMVCRRSSGYFSQFMTSRTFCAGQQDGVGPCTGDSGAGFMIKYNDRWFLRGIVSAGQTENSICNLREFVLYCDVAKHSTWVRDKLV